MLDRAQIEDLLPHRHPLLLLDAVTALDPWVSLVAVKHVTASEPCYARKPRTGHSDDLYPCSLILESFAQSAAVLVCGWWRDHAAPPRSTLLFGSVFGARFEARDVAPGDSLEHRTRLLRRLSDVAILAGETWTRGQPVLRVERLVVKYVAAPETHRPAQGDGP